MHRASDVATTTVLQGYGVNLDIKNMEYMNIDDSRRAEESEVQNNDTSEAAMLSVENVSYIDFDGEQLNGFLFSVLLQRRPELMHDFHILYSLLKEATLNNTSPTIGIKAWKMRDIGLKAVTSIIQARDPLRRLTEIAQNFPTEVNVISNVKVTPELRIEIEENLNSAMLRQGFLGGGGSSLFVNGRAFNIDLNTFNVFSLLRTIRAEAQQLEILKSFRLPASAGLTLLEVATKSSADAELGQERGRESEVRIDIVTGSKGAIHFLNNIEKDFQYKKWPRSLRHLLYPSWSLHALRRNLYTLICVIDPTTEDGLRSLRSMGQLYRNLYPIRFGLVLVSQVCEHYSPLYFT